MAVAKVMADAKVTSILRDLDTEIEERYYSIRILEIEKILRITMVRWKKNLRNPWMIMRD